MDEDSPLRFWFLVLLLVAGCTGQPPEQAAGRVGEPPDRSQGENGFPLIAPLVFGERGGALAPIYAAYTEQGTVEAEDLIFQAEADGRFAEFSHSLNEIQVGLSRSRFEWEPDESLDPANIRRTVESCLVLGLHRERERLYPEASDAYLTALELAARFSHPDSPELQSMSLDLQGQALTALLRLLGKEHLSYEALGSTFRRLDRLGEIDGLLRSSDQGLRTRHLISRWNAARVVVALQRFHSEFHHYPAKLRALTPDFLTEIPRDPLNSDGVFLYQPDGPSFLLQTATSAREDLDVEGVFYRHYPPDSRWVRGI